MALTSAPYGLRPVNLLGGQSFAGATRLYAIPSGYAVSIQTGDPVIVTNTGSTRGTIARMNATTTATTVTNAGGGFGYVGVFQGCTYTDPVFGKIFRQTYVAGTVAPDIQAYIASGEPFGKAGAYGIQGRAGAFIRHLSGSYSGVMGLPLYETRCLLQKTGLMI